MMTNSPERIKYTRREGTLNMGGDYEIDNLALLALRCIRQTEGDFWIASNVEEAGSFDDIVLHLGEQTFMFQLKYKQNPKGLAKDQVKRYIQTICNLKSEIDSAKLHNNVGDFRTHLGSSHKICFLLYTNADVSHFNFLKPAENGSYLSYFKSKTDSQIFQIDVDKAPDYRNLDYINQFYLLSNQTRDIPNEIEEEIEEITRSHESKTISDHFRKFISMWSKGYLGGYYCLTRSDIVSKLTELLFCTPNYEVPLLQEPYSSYNCEQKLIWNKIIEDKIITVIRINEDNKLILNFLLEYIGNEVRKFCSTAKKDNWFQTLTEEEQELFYKQDGNFKLQMLKVVNGSSKISLFDVYKCLWSLKKLPLLLKIDKQEQYEQIHNILKWSKDSYRLIILNKSEMSLVLNNDLSHFENLRDLNHNHRDAILKQPVKLQGRTGSKLRNLLDESMFEEIKTSDIISILLNNFNIGKELKPLPNYYIQRTFLNVLSLDILKYVADDIFSIQDPNDFLKDFKVNSKNVIFKSEQLPLYGKNVHYLTALNANYLLWNGSRGDINKIINQLQFDSTCKKDYYLPSLVTIISADPGMGKSMLMDCIAQQVPTDKWVIKIVLGEYNSYYLDVRQKKGIYKPEEHLNYFKASLDTELENKIFNRLLETKNIVILMDGFDEISLYYREEVTDIAKSFSDEKFCICITTRPEETSHLENKFNVTALELLPFNSNNQKQFLKNYFIRDLTVSSSADLDTFVEALLLAFEKNTKHEVIYVTNRNDFIATPLHIKLLAVYFKDDCNRYLSNKCKIDFNQNFNLVDLYDTFINKKEKILFNKGIPVNFNREFQSLVALKLLFPDYKEYIDKLIVKLKKSNYNLVAGDGILMAEEKTGNVSFVHRTFAEYLAADWLFKNTDSNVADIKDMVKKIYDQCVGIFDFFRAPCPFLLNVFDRLLIGKPLEENDSFKDLYLAVINRQVGKAKKNLNLDSVNLNATDSARRSILHVMAIYAEEDYLKDIFLAVVEKTKIRPDVFGYNQIDYALGRRKYEWADKMCEKWPNAKVSICIDEYKTFLYCFRNLCYLVKSLLPYFAYKDIMLKKVEQHITVYSYLENIIYDNDDTIRYDMIDDTNILLSQLPLLEIYTKSNLCYEVVFGNTDTVSKLLQTTDQVNMRDANDLTPLLYAALYDKYEVIDLLLTNNADANITKAGNETPLHYSIEHGNFKAFCKLLNKTNLDARDINMNTPLHYAVMFRRLPMIKILLSKGADIKLENWSNSTPLCLAAQCGNNDIWCSNYSFNSMNFARVFKHVKLEEDVEDEINKIIEFFVSKYININVSNSGGFTPLHHSVMCGYSKITEKLISHGADVNAVDNRNVTPLHCAFVDCYGPCLKIIKLLLSNSADVNIRNIYGHTALHLSIKHDYDLSNGTPLCDAVVLQQKNLDAVKLLLANGADIAIKSLTGKTSLHFGIMYGNAKIVDKLISYNVGINAQDHQGNTPLHHALLERRDISIIRSLLSNNADVMIKNLEGNTPLHFVVMCDTYTYRLKSYSHSKVENTTEDIRLDILELLLSNVANLKVKNMNGDTPLQCDVKYDNYLGVDKIVHCGADLNAQNNAGNTPLHEALSWSRWDVIDLLLCKEINVNIKNVNGETPLHLAIRYGISIACTYDNAQKKLGNTLLYQNIYDRSYILQHRYFGDLIHLILHKGANANIKNVNGDTPLHLVGRHGNYTVIHYLVAYGADINAQNNEGNTPLHKEILENRCYRYELDLLLIKGADVNLKNNDSETSLHLAVSRDNFIAVYKIIPYNADLNAQNNKGNTPLHLALSENKDWELIDLLLLKGASVNVKNNDGETPLHFGIRYSDPRIIDRILSFNADVNAQNSAGETPLHLSVSVPNKLRIFSWLIRSGADENITNSIGETPLQISAKYNTYDTVNQFIQEKNKPPVLRPRYVSYVAELYDPSLKVRKSIEMYNFKFYEK